jgi:hypothetical protein
MTREEWLYKLADLIRPVFKRHGFEIPKFRAAVGFGANGVKGASTGECWNAAISDDGHYEIFLNPGRADSIKVACTFTHELIHAAVGLEHGHRGDFAKLALAVGFRAPLTEAQQPDTLTAWLKPLVEKIGAFPHAALRSSFAGSRTFRKGDGGISLRKGVDLPADRGSDDDDSDDEPVESTRPPKQDARLIKCECGECGYVVRTTRKWLEIGAPHCPNHGAMNVESKG